MSKKTNKNNKKSFLLYFVDVIVGGLSGLVGGLFGGGAGTLIVPMLTEINKLDTKKAHATAILTVLPLTICSSIVFYQNGYYDNTVFTYCVIGSIVGGFIGSSLLKKLPNEIISLVFSFVMLIAGIQMIK